MRPKRFLKLQCLIICIMFFAVRIVQDGGIISGVILYSCVFIIFSHLIDIIFIRWGRHPETENADSHLEESYSPALSHVDAVLKFLNLFLPSRIMKEDAGDAREVINNLVKEAASTWMIYTKLTSSVFWILLAAAREVLTVTKKKPN